MDVTGRARTPRRSTARPALRVQSAPPAGNHGPVRVRNQFHFAHADGTPYFPFGTTCYAWTHQPLDMQEQTSTTLRTARFNKLRMGVFPKHYTFNENEPLFTMLRARAPTASSISIGPIPTPSGISRRRSAALRDMGIEADIIIFHPYDRWGYCDMSAEQDYRYVAISRRGSRPIAMSGGRSPTNTTSCSTPSRSRSGIAISTSSRKTTPTGI